jgi:hypothetical protein
VTTILSESAEAELTQKIVAIVTAAVKIELDKRSTLQEYMKRSSAAKYIDCTEKTIDALVAEGMPRIEVGDMKPKYSKTLIDKFMLQHQK